MGDGRAEIREHCTVSLHGVPALMLLETMTYGISSIPQLHKRELGQRSDSPAERRTLSLSKRCS